jgi:hypothetical protein
MGELCRIIRHLGSGIVSASNCWPVGRNGDGEHFTLLAYGATPERLLDCVKAGYVRAVATTIDGRLKDRYTTLRYLYRRVWARRDSLGERLVPARNIFAR